MTWAARIIPLYDWAQKYFFADVCCAACKVPFIPSTHEHFQQKYLCPPCQAKIPLKPPTSCMLCGHILGADVKQNICLQCLKNPPPWDGLNYFSVYDGLLKTLILKYKFSKDFSLIPLLTYYLFYASKDLPLCDVIIPMPRHKKRLRVEGFNQVVELCKFLSKISNISLTLDSLQRTRYTPPQAGLMATARRTNPKKSFSACNVQGKKVLLVDDVLTTGATLHHATLALKKAQASEVFIIIIARVEK